MSSALRGFIRTYAENTRTSFSGYAVAVLVPLIAVAMGTRLGMPAFVFEHLAVLFVVAVAIQWGMRPALVAAVAASLGDNLLLREPIGRPAVTGVRDVLDLILFVVVAATVGWLVASARREKVRAQLAADLERRAREERDRLVMTISHDLATPLAAIRGTVQFAQRFGRRSDIDIVRLMTRVDSAAARAISLVRTLNDVRTLDSGELSLHLETTDVRSLLASVVQMLDRFSERHPIALAMPEEPVFIRCDRDRLQRVFDNLVMNAIKYSPDGGAVEVTLRIEAQRVVVCVRDYGMGISPGARPRIFERAYRAPEAEATAPGLGLGLNIAAEIVQRHGGTIDVHAALPNGTSVLVRLPATSTAHGVEAGARNTEKTPLADGLSRKVDGGGAPAAE
jgi:signal transduction histidine kinase